MAVIDGSTNQVTTFVPLPCCLQQGTAVAVSPITGNVYVGGPVDQLTSDIFEINGQTNQVIKTISVSGTTSGIAVNPVTAGIYVVNFSIFGGTGSVLVINSQTNQVTGSICVGLSPGPVAINPHTGIVYVGNHGGNPPPGTVSVISPSPPS